jgi:2-hydroxy-3-keto-5-methylthiopentenyl-1-phosphate phosphatase
VCSLHLLLNQTDSPLRLEVSDLSAARAANLLFVKVIEGHTNDLSVHCIREKIPFVAFEQFLQVKATVESVILGGKSIESILKVE